MESHLRRFADLVGFRIRTRHAERRLDALEGRNLPGGGAANGASEGELDLGDDGSDSDDSHQSRLERVAQLTIGPVPGNTNPPGTHTNARTGAAPAYADSDAADAQADFRRPTCIGSIATGTVPIISDRAPLCNLPNCPRRRWDTSHSYCGCTHATEHAAAVSCSLATGGSGTVGNAGTEREESSAARAEVDAQFFERTVTGATRAASDDDSCDLPGCQNVRIAGDTDDHTHRYCCRLHSQAHLPEPCDDPEKATDGGAGVTHKDSALTFDDVGRAIGGLGGEPRSGVRFAIFAAVDRAPNVTPAASFAEAFRNFESERPNWQRELAEAPPHVAPGAHVIDMPEGSIEADLLHARGASILRAPWFGGGWHSDVSDAYVITAGGGVTTPPRPDMDGLGSESGTDASSLVFVPPPAPAPPPPTPPPPCFQNGNIFVDIEGFRPVVFSPHHKWG